MILTYFIKDNTFSSFPFSGQKIYCLDILFSKFRSWTMTPLLARNIVDMLGFLAKISRQVVVISLYSFLPLPAFSQRMPSADSLADAVRGTHSHQLKNRENGQRNQKGGDGGKSS